MYLFINVHGHTQIYGEFHATDQNFGRVSTVEGDRTYEEVNNVVR